MKAVILAGGEGTRLRAVSGGVVKPMMPILGVPLLAHIVALLREHGFSDICMALRREPEQIRGFFKDGSAFGVRASYSVEDEPLGTAGAVGRCRDFAAGEPFLVISGDAACDFDLSALMRAHAKSGALATIALCPREEPLSYGLVLAGREGRVTGFLEKPDWGHVVTDMVSTGIYALSPGVFSYIPEQGPCDFARDLFPALLRAKKPLNAWQAEGYWCDIGTPRAYYQCNLDALDGRLRLPGGETGRRVIPCRSRARLMRAMSEALAEFGADYTDGLSLSGPEGSARVKPLAGDSAVSVEGSGPLCRRLSDLARNLEANL